MKRGKIPLLTFVVFADKLLKINILSNFNKKRILPRSEYNISSKSNKSFIAGVLPSDRAIKLMRTLELISEIPPIIGIGIESMHPNDIPLPVCVQRQPNDNREQKKNNFL